MDFGSLFAAIGRALPGFVEGERMAIQDNWTDLNQYNKVQAGQLENAFTEQTFNPRTQIVYDAARNSGLGVLNNRMTTAQNMTIHPAIVARNYWASLYAPQNAQLEQQLLANMYRLMPGMLAGAGAGATGGGLNPMDIALYRALLGSGLGGAVPSQTNPSSM